MTQLNWLHSDDVTIFSPFLRILIDSYTTRWANVGTDLDEKKDLSSLIQLINALLQQNSTHFPTLNLNNSVLVFTKVLTNLSSATNTAATAKTCFNALIAKASISLIKSADLEKLENELSEKISRLKHVTQSLFLYFQVPQYNEQCQERKWAMYRLLLVQSVIQRAPWGDGNHGLVVVEAELKTLLVNQITMLGSVHISPKHTKNKCGCPFVIKPDIVVPADNARVCTIRLPNMLSNESEALVANDPLRIKCSTERPSSILKSQSAPKCPISLEITIHGETDYHHNHGCALDLGPLPRGGGSRKSKLHSDRGHREYKIKVYNEQEQRHSVYSTLKVDQRNNLQANQTLSFYRHSPGEKSKFNVEENAVLSCKLKGKIYFETSMMVHGNSVSLRVIRLDFNNIESTINSTPFMLLTHPSTEDEKFRPIQLAKMAAMIDRMCYWKVDETRPRCSLDAMPVTFMHRDQNGCPYNPGPLLPYQVGPRASEDECCAILSQYAERLLGFSSPEIVSDTFLNESYRIFIGKIGNQLDDENRYDILSISGYYDVSERFNNVISKDKTHHVSLFNMTIGQLVDLQPSCCSNIVNRPIDKIRKLIIEKFILIGDREGVVRYLPNVYRTCNQDVVVLRFSQSLGQHIHIECVQNGMFWEKLYPKKTSTSHVTETPYDSLFQALLELAGKCKLVQHLGDTAKQNPSKKERDNHIQSTSVLQQQSFGHIPGCATGVLDNGQTGQRNLPGRPMSIDNQASPLSRELFDLTEQNQVVMGHNNNGLIWSQTSREMDNYYSDTALPCSSNSLNTWNRTNIQHNNAMQMANNGLEEVIEGEDGYIYFRNNRGLM